MDEKLKLTKLEAKLSNERTLLSYIRTSASVLVLAVAFFKFFEEKVVIYTGIAVLVVGIAILILGLQRYFQERHRISRIVSS